MLKQNRLLHFFTNTIIFGNTTWRRGRGNVFTGRLAAMRCRTQITVIGDNNHISLADGMLNCCKIYIRGSGNALSIDSNCSIHHAVIWISGDNNTISLGKTVHIFNADLGAEHSGSVLRLKDGAQIGGFMPLGWGSNKTMLSRVYASEGRCVEIGEGSAISDAVTIRTSDSHPIYDDNAVRINPAKDIVIGNGVWVCSGSTLLKGAGIGDGSILGGGSMLTKNYSSISNVLLAGSPAKPLRENIRWEFNVDGPSETGG